MTKHNSHKIEYLNYGGTLYNIRHIDAVYINDLNIFMIYHGNKILVHTKTTDIDFLKDFFKKTVFYHFSFSGHIVAFIRKSSVLNIDDYAIKIFSNGQTYIETLYYVYYFKSSLKAIKI